MQTVEKVEKHKALKKKKKKFAFGIILFRRENGPWKLKGTANFKKVTGRYYSPV